MASFLIGLVTCKKHEAFLQAAKDTWIKDIPPDVHIVFADEHFMPAGIPDTYENLPHKTKELCRYALKHCYRWLAKIDVDCLVRPRLLRPPYGHDYAGRFRGRSAPECVPEGVVNKSDFCSGGAYWLSSRAMQIVIQSPLTQDKAEDRFVGNTLNGYGIAPFHLAGYIAPTCWPPDAYYRNPDLVVLMQMEDPKRMRNVYAGIIEEPRRAPIGSLPEDYPVGHPMRTQMRKT